MNRALPASAGLLLAALSSGCGPAAEDPYASAELGPARDVVVRAIEATGGLEAWRGAGPLAGDAVLALYDAQGRKRILAVSLRADLPAGRLHAEGRTPQGRWQVTADQRGNGSVEGAGLDPSTQKRVLSALRLLAHRLRGPTNLLVEGVRPQGTEGTRLVGVDLTRVPVRGDRQDVAAYYFAAQSGRLKFVTAGGDEPGADGSVTIYEYSDSPPVGLAPRRIRVVRIGRNVLVGDRRVLDLELLRLRMQ